MYSYAGHQVTYAIPREMWSTIHGPGVSTMEPQVTERKLLLLTAIWLHSNTDSFSRDLGFCTLKTQAENYCSRQGLMEQGIRPQNMQLQHTNFEKKAKQQRKTNTALNEALTTDSYNGTGD